MDCLLWVVGDIYEMCECSVTKESLSHSTCRAIPLSFIRRDYIINIIKLYLNWIIIYNTYLWESIIFEYVLLVSSSAKLILTTLTRRNIYMDLFTIRNHLETLFSKRIKLKKWKNHSPSNFNSKLILNVNLDTFGMWRVIQGPKEFLN